jgi:hypothetical protein
LAQIRIPYKTHEPTAPEFWKSNPLRATRTVRTPRIALRLGSDAAREGIGSTGTAAESRRGQQQAHRVVAADSAAPRTVFFFSRILAAVINRNPIRPAHKPARPGPAARSYAPPACISAVHLPINGRGG